jgi:predicted esterase YcpF (UPF0227 family)
MILYLHGFRSSPTSFKAQLMAQAVSSAVSNPDISQHWACPALPASPALALELALEYAKKMATQAQSPLSALTIIGSSLGGFYATVLAERLGCKAVLLNPAVHAPRDLATQVGTHQQYHSSEPFHFLPAYVDELQRMAPSQITKPQRYLLIAATGDEVLDWREMRDFFAGSAQIIVQGSDHGLSDFATHIPAVLAFANAELAPTQVK